MKLQAPNTKLQKNFKLQTSNFRKTSNSRSGVTGLRGWSLKFEV
jgi:hypothetical protein